MYNYIYLQSCILAFLVKNTIILFFYYFIYTKLSGYENDHAYLGSTIGRYANRITGGKFTIDGTTYNINKNEASCVVHGGVRGWDKVKKYKYIYVILN